MTHLGQNISSLVTCSTSNRSFQTHDQHNHLPTLLSLLFTQYEP